MRHRTAAMIGLCVAAAALGGCASRIDASAPAWAQEAAQAPGYPELSDVPEQRKANGDPAHWAAVRADLLAVGAAVRASPRSEPAAPNSAEAFLEEAREDLEATRAAHAD